MGLTLHYRSVGLEESATVEVSPWVHWVKTYAESSVPGGSPTGPPNVPYLVKGDLPNSLDCLPGSWQLTEPLIIPPGFTLRCGPGG